MFPCKVITHKQQRAYLKFIKEDSYYKKFYEAIYILFHTGLRISEFCGLTIQDVDFKEMRIKVDHQLQYINGKGKKIQEPKTDSGVRFVRIIADALFRYFGKCCSDIIDIVPLKGYTIS